MEFDYGKFKITLQKTCDEIWKELREMTEQRMKLENGEVSGHVNKISLLMSEETYAKTLIKNLDEAINAIEHFWEE